MKYFEVMKERREILAAAQKGDLSAVQAALGIKADATQEPVVKTAPVPAFNSNVISYERYSAMSPEDKAAFFRRGGKLANVPTLLRRADNQGPVQAVSQKTMTHTEFRKLTAREKSEWWLSGGKINQ